MTADQTDLGYTPLKRPQMAARIANDIPGGWYVNLGIGIPTLVADFVPAEREVIFQSENGVLGMGPAPAEEDINPWLINAGKLPITLADGGSFFNQADSFAMIRGAHLDLCVLGAYEVAQNGDIANWATSATDTAPAVGGAMDLAAGTPRLWVIMEHTTRDGKPKLVKSCNYPITAAKVVQRIYTNLAVIDVEDGRLRVVEMIDGMNFDDLQNVTDAPLLPPAD